MEISKIEHHFQKFLDRFLFLFSFKFEMILQNIDWTMMVFILVKNNVADNFCALLSAHWKHECEPMSIQLFYNISEWKLLLQMHFWLHEMHFSAVSLFSINTHNVKLIERSD